MTDFKGFNPDKNLGTQFNSNRKSKEQKPDAKPEAAEVQAQGDPHADLKMDPDRMLDLLAAQGKASQTQITGVAHAASIERAMDNFTTQISPERHSLLTRMLEQTYEGEFGKKPSAPLLQDILDNYLIGQVAIQTS